MEGLGESTDARMLDFDDPALAARVEKLSTEVLDVLPFGVIRLDADDRVTYFSASEAKQSGYLRERAIGRGFFTDVAPCIGTAEFLERIVRARRAGTLDVVFEQLGDFRDKDRPLRVRLQSAPAGGLWVFLKRPA